MFYSTILILILAPFILNGNFNVLSIYIIVTAIFVMFIFDWKRLIIQKTISNTTLIAFILTIIFSLFFSIQINRSIPVIIWWIVHMCIFILCQYLSKREQFLITTSKLFVILTAVFGVISIYNFIHIGLTSYTRLDGFIGTHNIYGGFLIIPFLLSVFLILTEKQPWQKIAWYISGTIIFSSLILTFSRGTWVSIVAALVVSMIIFRRKIWPSTGISGFIKSTQKIVILVVLLVITVMGIWQLAKESTLRQEVSRIDSVAVFSNESAEENAYVARLHYIGDAWNTFVHRPITGFGPGTYTNAMRMYKTDPNYSSFADPHNWLLKMLVENGLVTTTVFVVFIVSLFWQMSHLILKRKEFPWLAVTIYTALVGGTIHGLMDFDWSVNLLMIVFFVFAGSLYGYLLNSSENDSEKVKFFPKWILYILVLLLILSSVVSVYLLRADLARAKGDVYLDQIGDANGAINSYFESAILNPREPSTYFSLWRAYFIAGNYNAARNCINKAISLSPENGSYYLALARADEALGDYRNYRETLLKSIKYFPAGDLTNYQKLVAYDYGQKKYDVALATIDEVLPIYTKYQSKMWFKSDPNAPMISQNIAKLKEYKRKINTLLSQTTPPVSSSR